MSEPDKDWDLPERKPVAAGLAALRAFFLASLIANAFVHLLEWAEPEQIGVGSSVLVHFMALGTAGPFVSMAVRSSRTHRAEVARAATAIPLLVYLAALALGLRFVTDWLYPHVPGTQPGLTFWPVAGALAAGAYFYLCASVAASDWSPPPPPRPVWPPVGSGSSVYRDEERDWEEDEAQSLDREDSEWRDEEDPDDPWP